MLSTTFEQLKISDPNPPTREQVGLPAIKKPVSWQKHIQSVFYALAICAFAASVITTLGMGIVGPVLISNTYIPFSLFVGGVFLALVPLFYKSMSMTESLKEGRLQQDVARKSVKQLVLLNCLSYLAAIGFGLGARFGFLPHLQTGQFAIALGVLGGALALFALMHFVLLPALVKRIQMPKARAPQQAPAIARLERQVNILLQGAWDQIKRTGCGFEPIKAAMDKVSKHTDSSRPSPICYHFYKDYFIKLNEGTKPILDDEYVSSRLVEAFQAYVKTLKIDICSQLAGHEELRVDSSSTTAAQNRVRNMLYVICLHDILNKNPARKEVREEALRDLLLPTNTLSLWGQLDLKILEWVHEDNQLSEASAAHAAGGERLY